MFLCRDEKDRQRSLELLYMLWDAGHGSWDTAFGPSTSACRLRGRTSRSAPPSSNHAFSRVTPVSTMRSSGPCRARSFIGSLPILSGKRSRSGLRRARNTAVRSICGNPTSRNAKADSGIFIRRSGSPLCTFGSRRSTNLSEKTVITGGQYAVFLRSRNFLWRVRNEIHYLSGRKNDHLTFDLQERAAKDFKYRDSAASVRGRTIYEGLLSPREEYPRIYE